MSRKVSPSEVRASRRVRQLLRARTQRMLQQISRVRRRASADAVHDLRVATRRLHEALVFFKPDLPARPRGRLIRRARRIRRELGRVRNADVTLELLSASGRGLKGADSELLADLRERLRSDAAAWRGGAGGRGGIPVPGARWRCQVLLRELGGRRAVPGWARGAASLGARSREIRRRIRPAKTGEAAALHHLRIAVKRYRYSLEILQELGWSQAAPWIAAARRIQLSLGRLHDLDVLMALIRAEARGPAAQALLGRLSEERKFRLARILAAVEEFQPEEALKAMMTYPEPAR